MKFTVCKNDIKFQGIKLTKYLQFLRHAKSDDIKNYIQIRYL